MSVTDIPLLTLLRAASQKQDQIAAIPPEVDALARSEIYPVFENPCPDGLYIGEIAALHARKCNDDLRCRTRLDARKPIGKRAASMSIDVFDDLHPCR